MYADGIYIYVYTENTKIATRIVHIVKLYKGLDAGLLKTLKQLRLYTKMSRRFDQQLRSSSVEMY